MVKIELKGLKQEGRRVIKELKPITTKQSGELSLIPRLRFFSQGE